MDKTDLKKIANTREAILAVCAIGLLMIIFFKVIYSSRADALGELKTKIKTLQSEEKSLKKTNQTLKEQKSKSNVANTPKTPGIKMQILKGERKAQILTMPELLQTITQPDFLQGMVITSLSSNTSQSGSGFTKTPLVIKGKGSFLAITSFMDKLDNLVTLFAIDSVSIISTPELAGIMDVEINTTLYKVEGTHVIPTTQ